MSTTARPEAEGRRASCLDEDPGQLAADPNRVLQLIRWPRLESRPPRHTKRRSTQVAEYGSDIGSQAIAAVTASRTGATHERRPHWSAQQLVDNWSTQQHSVVKYVAFHHCNEKNVVGTTSRC